MYTFYIRTLRSPLPRSMQKILLIMKLTTSILLATLLQASAHAVAQKITLSEKNSHLLQVFEKIRQQAGFDFLYTREMLKDVKPVSISVKNMPLEEVLHRIFTGQPVGYEIRNNAVVITRRPATIVEGMPPPPANIDVKGRIFGVKDEPLRGVSVKVKTTGSIVLTDEQGAFEIKNIAEEAVLEISFIGYKTLLIPARQASKVIRLELASQNLDQVVVTALGVKQESRALGTAVTVVKGSTVQEAQRENFLNALQGRVAGIEVANTSGLPGASSSIVIRGITSLSGSNQPLFIVDGLPIDNTTFGAEALASNAPGSSSGISSKNLDFSNRAADLNPDDIESITILKGPEASALYGIDAASGAIVITTKKGKAGAGRISYQNSFKIARATRYPSIQQVFGQGVVGSPNAASFSYFGPKYASGQPLFDNIKPFFQTAFTQKHNISAEGGSEYMTYRFSSGYIDENGIIPGAGLKRFNISSALSAKISTALTADVTMNYIYQLNDQVFKGENGALIGLLTWPSTDDARNYLNPDGSRRPVSTAANLTDEPENPYFLSAKNKNKSTLNRFVTNASVTLAPVKWFSSKAQVGIDVYSNDITILRHPESNFGFSKGGLIDNAIVNNRNINAQFLNTFKRSFGRIKTTLLAGASLNDSRYVTNAVTAENFQVPEFFNINNTLLGSSRPVTQYRNRFLVGLFADANISYNSLVYLTLTGRNDWTSTLAPQNRSFPSYSAQLAFIVSELSAFKNLPWLSFAKLRGSVGSTGKDAPPYSIFAALESQVTTGGGYAYGNTGPSPNLRAERTRSHEMGLEAKFFKNRLGIDIAYYKKNSVDQIISDLRLSYATGSILQVFNGGNLWNKGVEIQLDATPVENKQFSWNILANFNATRSKLESLPQDLPEFYVSTTRLGDFNVRNGAMPGGTVTSFTGRAYLRNNRGDILINPATGLPLREATDYKKIGDRNPDFAVGISNTFRYKNFTFSFLLDMRKGGDIFNGTELYLVARGLSQRTLNRQEPVIIKGVLKDGLENTDNPTVNAIQVTPYNSVDFYSITAGTANEEDYIEKNISWIRLKDMTFSYEFGKPALKRIPLVRSASVFLTATDLFLITNYSGLDPVVNGNNASIGGSGSVGFDFGNFAFPVALNLGVRLGF